MTVLLTQKISKAILNLRNVVVLILIVLCCCVPEKKHSTAEKHNTPIITDDFEKFLDNLPRVALPFQTNCEQCCYNPSVDHEDELLKKYLPEGTTLVGLVERTSDRAVILVTYAGDMFIPSLQVYDMTGNVTGDMEFLTAYCGGEPGFYGRQFLQIDKDLSISQIDSSYYMTVDSINYITIDTTNVEITKKRFTIDKDGKIVEASFLE